MRRLSWAMLPLLLFSTVYPAFAWFNGGHMLVAYIAYRKLRPHTRSRVDALLRLNPMYAQWIAGVDPEKQAVTAFLRAATWPDCIKSAQCSPGYDREAGDVPPGKPTDAQNIGYADKLMHRYWHFVDIPYSAGAPGLPPKNPNALSEIKLLSQALHSQVPDDTKSYDVVWLEHLVGDLHQPLHATSRFTKNHPQGDAGGNLVPFCAKPCTDELHAYWDGLLGDDSTPAEITQAGDALLAKGRPRGVGRVTPDSWTHQSFSLAKTAVYQPPISDDNTSDDAISPRPDAAYAGKAHEVANAQALLGGYRLAALLNKDLK